MLFVSQKVDFVELSLLSLDNKSKKSVFCFVLFSLIRTFAHKKNKTRNNQLKTESNDGKNKEHSKGEAREDS